MKFSRLSINYLVNEKPTDLKGQFLRSIVVGLIGFVVDAGTLFLLILLPFFRDTYLWAVSIAFCVGLALNYYLSVIWVFPERKHESHFTSFVIFTLIGAVGFIINALIIWSLTDHLLILWPLGKQARIMLAKVFATMITFLWNFAARKFALFSPTKEKKPE
jgi:putative flippase GtrA